MILLTQKVGSGCLDLCWVGCGRVDAVYSGVAGEGWQPWDYAAGWLFIEEAGGVVTQVSTGRGLFWGPRLVFREARHYDGVFRKSFERFSVRVFQDNLPVWSEKIPPTTPVT